MGAGTVTLTVATVVLPAASYAVAVIVWEPTEALVASQVAAKGAAVSESTRVPSTLNSTRVTATLSEAVAAMFTRLETVAPEAGAVIETDGAAVSGAMPVWNFTSSIHTVPTDVPSIIRNIAAGSVPEDVQGSS